MVPLSLEWQGFSSSLSQIWLPWRRKTKLFTYLCQPCSIFGAAEEFYLFIYFGTEQATKAQPKQDKIFFSLSFFIRFNRLPIF